MYVLFIIFKPKSQVDSPNSNFHFSLFLPKFCAVNNSADTCKRMKHVLLLQSMSHKMQTFVIVMVVMVLGAPTEKSGDWGWDKKIFANNSYRILPFVKKALFSLVWHTKMSSVFGTGRSMNSMVWKLAKWAKFVLVLMNTHMLKKLRLGKQQEIG